MVFYSSFQFQPGSPTTLTIEISAENTPVEGLASMSRRISTCTSYCTIHACCFSIGRTTPAWGQTCRLCGGRGMGAIIPQPYLQAGVFFCGGQNIPRDPSTSWTSWTSWTEHPRFGGLNTPNLPHNEENPSLSNCFRLELFDRANRFFSV